MPGPGPFLSTEPATIYSRRSWTTEWRGQVRLLRPASPTWAFGGHEGAIGCGSGCTGPSGGPLSIERALSTSSKLDEECGRHLEGQRIVMVCCCAVSTGSTCQV